MSDGPQKLDASLLRRVVPLDDLSFENTAQLPPSEVIIGQERALSAIRLGIGMHGPGFNVFAVGLAATGRQATVRRIFDEIKPRRRRRRDFVFVANLENPARPRLLVLPAGRGELLRKELWELRERLRVEVRRVLESEPLRKKRDRASHEQEVITRQLYGDMEERCLDLGLVLGSQGELGENRSVLLFPVDGEPMTRAALRVAVERGEVKPDQEVDEIAVAFDEMEQRLAQMSATVADHVAKTRRQLQGLEHKALLEGLKPVFEPLRKHFKAARKWLSTLHRMVCEMPVAFLTPQSDEHQTLLRAFSPNLLHRGERSQRAPVVLVGNPNFANLFGGVDMVEEGSAGFARLRGGAVLDADGGYLVINAREILEEPLAWRALKRMLMASQVEIRNPETVTGGAVSAIRPDPVPVDIKVVLLGDPEVYRFLRQQEPGFSTLFKVKADFASEVEITESVPDQYGLFVARLVSEEGLKHLDAEAVARLVEEAIRWAGRGGRISTRFGQLADVVREASHLTGGLTVRRSDVEQALADREYRLDLSRERIDQSIAEGRLHIEVQGEVVGQINALAVYHAGGLDFGRTFRVTARVGAGRGGVVSIEREIGLSGKTHDKGIAVLSGFLRGTFGRSRILALKASIGFEQTYVRIDGDSASSAELYALLSTIARIPLRQSIAVTGSVDQWGRIQPIGGVNEKIEGFYRACESRGLTGDQGVMIPAQNASDLMLSKEVVQACVDGQFQVWTVKSIEEGLAMLSGIEVGSSKAEDGWPEHTFFGRVESSLDDLIQATRRAKKPKANGN